MTEQPAARWAQIRSYESDQGGRIIERILLDGQTFKDGEARFTGIGVLDIRHPQTNQIIDQRQIPFEIDAPTIEDAVARFPGHHDRAMKREIERLRKAATAPRLVNHNGTPM